MSSGQENFLKSFTKPQPEFHSLIIQPLPIMVIILLIKESAIAKKMLMIPNITLLVSIVLLWINT